jgi:inhibitor of cysteine peptidase
VEVAVGDSFTVTLCSNPSTGLRWAELAEIGDPTVVEQVDHRFVSSSERGKKPPPPGTPGEEVWTFKALKESKSTLSVEYGQPWEGGTKADWTFVLTVVVK